MSAAPTEVGATPSTSALRARLPVMLRNQRRHPGRRHHLTRPATRHLRRRDGPRGRRMESLGHHPSPRYPNQPRPRRRQLVKSGVRLPSGSHPMTTPRSAPSRTLRSGTRISVRSAAGNGASSRRKRRTSALASHRYSRAL